MSGSDSNHYQIKGLSGINITILKLNEREIKLDNKDPSEHILIYFLAP